MKYYKKTKLKYFILFVLHNILPYLALAILIGYSFIQGEPKEKTVIGLSTICILILASIAAFTHNRMTCITWIAATLIYIGIKYIFPIPLICITVYAFFDDIIFNLLYGKYQSEYRQHKVLNEHEKDMQ